MESSELFDVRKRKLLSALCHGSVFFSTIILSVGVPIIVWVITDDPVVKDNAKEAINFHFNIWFWGIIIIILCVLTLGLLWFVLPPIGYLLHWGLTIWAIWRSLTKVNEPVRYPFILRLL